MKYQNSAAKEVNKNLNRKPYPSQLIIDVHSYCNAKCLICPYNSLKKDIQMGIMPDRLFNKIVYDYTTLCEKYNFKGHVLFCNMGELCIYPNTTMQRMKLVINQGLDFDIQTNASLLTPETVDKIIQTGFSGSIVISCHGISPDVYSKIMGLNLNTTLKNIDYLLTKYNNSKIGIQSIPYNWPLGESRKIHKYWKSKGISVRMPLPNNRGGLLTNINDKTKKSVVGCTAGRPLGEMVICFNGDVVLCCNDMGQKEVIGSLQNNTIEEVWNGPGMVARLKQIYFELPSAPDFICKRCEFGITSHSKLVRLKRNLIYELRKFFLTRIW
ncbi:MAG: SPASM domain-containing protein [Desulfobacterales bacterium]